jgi:regulator of protease activity HflC (stomatin/prohibitin superfamily)
MFDYTTKDGEPNISKIVAHSILGLLILILLFSIFGSISAGYKGVRTQFGAVIGSVDSGLYVKVPFIQNVVKMNVQTQKEQVNAESASSDLQNVSTTIALNYNLYPDKVSDLFAKIGLEYKTRIIDPAIQEAVKASTAKHTAEQLITKRTEVRDEIKSILTERLAKEFIQVTEVSIVNFDFSSSFNQAIEAKVTAEQNALAAKNKLEQVKFEAEQRVTQAKAEAEAIRIQAQAIQQQGGENYVDLKAIEKWNGILPTTFVPGSALPFINLK